MALSYRTDYFIYHETFDDEPIKTETHFHEKVEIYYLLDGVACLYANGCLYRLTAGDLIILPPYLYHKMWYETELHSRLLINVASTFVPRSVYHKLNNVLYVKKDSNMSCYFDNLFAKIKQAANSPDEYQEDTLHCLTMDLFLTAIKSNDNIPIPLVSNQYVSRAIAYIQDNFRSKLTLLETAAHCNVSPEYLSRIFKKETGITFQEYVKFCRLKTAHSILSRGTTMSVAEVAFSCGFNDSNYFSSLYKQTYRTSPSHARGCKENISE